MATKEKSKKNKESKKPVMTFKDYPVSISIWKNTAKVNKKTMIFYDSTLNISYKDEDDEYQTSSNFKELDLLKAGQLIIKAYNWIQNAKQKDYENTKGEEDEEDEEDEDDEKEE